MPDALDKIKIVLFHNLGIAQAIMGDPPVLLLDEPLNGLDRQGVHDVCMLLKQLRTQGKIILLASHHAEDINLLCDVVYGIEDGELTQKGVQEEASA